MRFPARRQSPATVRWGRAQPSVPRPHWRRSECRYPAQLQFTSGMTASRVWNLRRASAPRRTCGRGVVLAHELARLLAALRGDVEAADSVRTVHVGIVDDSLVLYRSLAAGRGWGRGIADARAFLPSFS